MSRMCALLLSSCLTSLFSPPFVCLQCLFLSSDYSQARLCVEYTLSHVTDIFDRASLFELLIQIMNQIDMQAALATGEQCLHELGIELDSHMSPELHAWLYAIPDLHDEATYMQHPVFSAPEMASPLAVYAMSIVVSITPALTYLNSPAFERFVITTLRLTMEQGVTPASAFSFGCLGMLQWTAWAKGDSEAGLLHYAFGRIAMLILQRYGDAARAMAPRTHTCALPTIILWHRPYRSMLPMLEAAFEEAIAMGHNAHTHTLMPGCCSNPIPAASFSYLILSCSPFPSLPALSLFVRQVTSSG